ncbi:hypothetical protein, conserved [Trypanosoma cruzi]|uniref:Raptor N-terminal CASPase-like domain-containing protein n=1 Tax=Trypanosoma cruzi (strain CL Brener) TaxID=353153 RepID=Q4DQN8_TRYCC|nr:hypothetical protein, conserved [Trypanosoma cruzi]EAN94843.1 hypothetical protein, conserved [Trypanosoma cruzi]|eukprot:XP_816694.1 hypothetical protein [Trypanosoma cruzi strain CL Brener]
MTSEEEPTQTRVESSSSPRGFRRVTLTGSVLNEAENEQGIPLEPCTDAEVEAMERQRWGRLVQEGLFHQSLHFQRWDKEALLRGSLYRTRTVAARTTVRPTTTAALVLSLNINPVLWLGENENEKGDEASPKASRLYVWRAPALLPGDNLNILSQLGQQLESQYRSLSKRPLIVSHCLNARPEGFVRALAQCRHQAGPQKKVIVHYGGHGVPRPRGGSLFLFSSNGEPVNYSLDTFSSQVGFPLVMVAECANAVSILHHLLENRQKEEVNNHFTYRQYGTNIGVSTLEESERPDMVPGWDRYEVASVAGMEGNAMKSTTNAPFLSKLRGLGSAAASSTNSLLHDDLFFFGATEEGALPRHPKLPSDILTSCLTTPLRMALLWFIVEHAQTADIHPLLIYLIPGELTDKKTPLGALQWAFMSITECIAWFSFPYALFMHLFREDVLVAPLFRGFLLADRIITALGGKVTVYPPLPRTSDHNLWDTLDNIIDRTFVSLWRAVRPTPPTVLNAVEFREWLDWNATSWRYEKGSMTLPSLGDRCVVVPDFLEEELNCLAGAVERITEQGFFRLVSTDRQRTELIGGSAITTRWSRAEDDSPLSFLRVNTPLNGGSFVGTKPFPHIMRLPMLLQGLLVMSHRDQATELVCRFVDAGPLAVTACAEVGIFSMALVHYWTRRDLRHLLPTLLFIYAKACYTDPSLGDADPAQRNVIIDTCMEILEHPVTVPAESSGEAGAWQRDVLGSWAEPRGQQLLAASLLTMICLHSGGGRRRCRERDAFRVCCNLLQEAAAKAPRVPLRENGLEGEGEEESGREENFWDDYSPGGPDSNPVLMTAYVLGLIALFVVIAWEGTLSVAKTDEKEEDEQHHQQKQTGGSGVGDALAVRAYISTAVDALQALLITTSSAIRGAAIKAITVVLVSLITDDETAVMCVRAIVKCTSVQRAPLEGNTDNRLEFVGALSLAIKWLIGRLSVSLSLEDIRRAVRCELNKAWRKALGTTTTSRGGEENITNCRDPDLPFVSPSPLAESPVASFTLNGVDSLLRMLAELTCRLGVASNDPCPLVAAHAQKILRDDLSMLHVRYLPLFQPAGNVPCGRGGATTTSRNSGIANFFSGVLNTLTSRGGKHAIREGHQSGHVLRSVGDEDVVEELLDTGVIFGERAAVSDVSVSLRTVSVHDNMTISSFVFTLLSFLGELLLIPMDDHDPRHPFNLEKDAYILQYLRRLRDELRVTVSSSYGSCGHEGHAVVSPLLPSASSWNHPLSLLMMPQEDGTRGHAPSLSSPLMPSSSTAGVDASVSWTTDRQNSFRLLAEKNISAERNGHIQVFTFHPTERHFITGTNQGVIQVWSFAELEGFILASSTSSPGSSQESGELCRLLSQIQPSEVVARPGCAMPPSTVLKYMYGTQLTIPQCVSLSGVANERLAGGAPDVPLSRRTGLWGTNDYGGRVARGVDPLTGLHLVDSAYRTLLCAVGRSGSVQMFSAYTDAATVRRVTSFATMTYEESLRSHQCLSSYHTPAMLLHVSGADGSIASWDLNCEQKVSAGAGRREILHSPSALASHPYDVFTFAVGAGSIYLYDLRNSSRSTHVLPDPTSLGQSLQRQLQSLGDYKPLCLHIGFSCRYPHGLVTGYGGEQGVVMMWDDRKLQQPFFQRVVSETGGAGSSSFNSVGYMDVQHYHYALMTLSVTADALFVGDALASPSSKASSSSGGGGNSCRAHIRLKQQPGAASFHPILPLCGVAGGNYLQLYGRKKLSMPERHA